jgi:phosphoesterase RecJ-like protein
LNRAFESSEEDPQISPKEWATLFQRELSGASSVLIGTHLNPDGDALGSALALSHYLSDQGIRNEVLCHHSPPANLEFLPGSSRVRQAPVGDSFELGVIVDLDAVDRLGNTEQYFANIPRIVVIDHHVPHEAPGDLRIVDTAAPATALILTRLLLQMEGDITPAIATCLLTGIVTDTGSFRFRNTTAESLSLSARLLELGGNINLVSEEIFQRKPLASARLLGYLLERMKLECADRLCYGTLDYDDFNTTNARDEDTEGFVNELLSISTVQIAVLFREPKPGRVRVSLRSRGDYDVAAVAREVGGGGHKNAAGCSFEANLAEALELIVPRLRDCLGSC